MRWQAVDALPCSIARTLAVVGERWTLLILREVFSGIRHFEGFQRHLGIARNVLATRLRRLVEAGVLERRAGGRGAGRAEYHLTERGRDLYPVLLALLCWGDRWTAGTAGPPVRLEHRGCGRDTAPVTVCAECGEPLHPDAVRVKAGPGLLGSAPGGPRRS